MRVSEDDLPADACTFDAVVADIIEHIRDACDGGGEGNKDSADAAIGLLELLQRREPTSEKFEMGT